MCVHIHTEYMEFADVFETEHTHTALLNVDACSNASACSRGQAVR